MPQGLGYREVKEASGYLAARWRQPPRVGVVLGSGLGEAVRGVRQPLKISFQSIPHFPRPTVEGHGGNLLMGLWGDVPVAVLEGRVHLYEGYTPAEVVFPARVLALAGIKRLVITCAAGGISPGAMPGRIMIFSDHLNLQGTSPLVGAPAEQWGNRFVDLSQTYDPAMRAAARQAARALGIKHFEGVYAAVLGPAYETPAEIQALKRLGADAVGMSTVPEVLAARQLGVRVLALATITNRAVGLSPKPLSHADVLRVGKAASRDLARLLETLMPQLDQESAAR